MQPQKEKDGGWRGRYLGMPHKHLQAVRFSSPPHLTKLLLFFSISNMKDNIKNIIGIVLVGVLLCLFFLFIAEIADKMTPSGDYRGGYGTEGVVE